jgi:serine/threonine-protein kinase HipA
MRADAGLVHRSAGAEPTTTQLRLAMKIGGDYQLNPHRNRWPDAVRDLGLPAAELVARASALAATAADAFADAAKAPDVLAQESELPARLTDLVAERSARCARLLGG